ncbi:MAG: DUF1801 domain-containing protein [Cyclobacteriaceae bacterium]
MTFLKYTGKDLQDISWEEWIEQKPEVLRPIAGKWFDIIKEMGSDVQPIFHDNYPIGCVDAAPFAYVHAFTAHVNVGFFHGVDLPDPAGLLEGTGKRMRHIKLRPDAMINEEAIREIIQHAYLDIKERLLTKPSF